MQRSTVLILLSACAAAVALALWWRGGEQPVVPPNAVQADPVDVPSEPADEHAGQHGQHEGPVPSDAPRVHVSVLSRERFVPPPPEQGLVTTFDGRPLVCRTVAGVGSGFDAPPARGVALVEVEVGGGSLLRQVAIGDGAAGPARLGTPVVVHGTVVDASGAAVPGASVWFGERGAGGERRVFRSDEEGRFQGDVLAGAGVPLVVSAEGFATSWRPIDVAPQMRELEHRLEPSTRLQLQLAGRAVAIDRARAFLVPTGRVSTGLSRWPFFEQALEHGVAFDEQGRATIEALPVSGTVGVVVRHPFAPLSRALEVELEAGISRAVVPLSLVDGRATITVSGADEQVPHTVHAWLGHGRGLDGARSLRLLPPHLDVRGACAASGPGGVPLELGVPARDDGGELMLSLRARGFAGRDLPWPVPEPAQLALAPWRGGEASLVVSPPEPGRVWRFVADLGGGIDVAVAADEAFVVALPHPGRFDVSVRVDGGEPRVLEALDATGPVEIETARR